MVAALPEEVAAAMAVLRMAGASRSAWPPLLCLQVGLALLVSATGLGWVGIDFSLFTGGQQRAFKTFRLII